MPLFLMSLLPAKATWDSIKWGGIAVLCGLLIMVGVSVLHTPSKVSYAISAEREKGNVAKLTAALNAEKAEKVAFADALESRKQSDRVREIKNAELSAALEKLKAENDALKIPRPDDTIPPLAADDPWLLRGTKAGSANRPGAPRR